MDVRVGLWRKLSAKELMLLNCGVGEDSWESLGLQGDEPVHSKGDKSWVFFGRNDAEAETPVPWPSVCLWTNVYSEPLSSVHFSHSVVSDSLWPHESQHARPPCPSPSPRVHSNSRPSSRWCHLAISSSLIPFSSCPQSLPASESFPMSQLFPWGGQSIGVSALASFLPKNTQDWSPLEWIGWITL